MELRVASWYAEELGVRTCLAQIFKSQPQHLAKDQKVSWAAVKEMSPFVATGLGFPESKTQSLILWVVAAELQHRSNSQPLSFTYVKGRALFGKK